MPAIALPEVETESRPETEDGTAPNWHVILFDDDDHTYAYVVEMMMNVFSCSPDRAWDIAYEVDYIGQAIVRTCAYEAACESRDAILSYGPDHRRAESSGSMTATIQRADE